MSDRKEREPQQSPDGVSPEAAAAVEKISVMLAEVEKLRKRQFTISSIGILAIVLVLGAFLMNLIALGSNFDQKAFARALVKRAPQLAESKEVQELRADFTNVFLPAFQEELSKKIQAEMPELQKAVEREGKETISFAEKDLRDRIALRLQKSFSKMEVDLIAKYGSDPKDKEELTKAMHDFKKVFIEDITKTLEKNLDKAQKSLTDLHGTVQSFKDLPEYSEVKKLDAGEVENRLIETFLELWIYNLNPNRGAAKLDDKGGI